MASSSIIKFVFLVQNSPKSLQRVIRVLQNCLHAYSIQCLHAGPFFSGKHENNLFKTNQRTWWIDVVHAVFFIDCQHQIPVAKKKVTERAIWQISANCWKFRQFNYLANFRGGYARYAEIWRNFRLFGIFFSAFFVGNRLAKSFYISW